MLSLLQAVAIDSKASFIMFETHCLFVFAGIVSSSQLSTSPSPSVLVIRICTMYQHKIPLALALAVALCGSASACTPSGMEVTKASAAFKPADSSSYTINDVNEHFKQMAPVKYLSNTGSTYTCVDARGDDAHLSTPG
jgi:hypothetical protein